MGTAKRKGDAFERACVAVFRDNGHPYAERVLRLGARDDRGDISGLSGVPVHVDCKARNRFDLNVWVDEVVAEAPTGTIPVVVLKRPRAHASRAYAVVELATFARMIAEGNGDE